MNNKQNPVNSPFNKDSTAVEVLRDASIAGKTVLVTGGHSGLGLSTSKAFANSGANVIVGARDASAARNLLSDTPSVSVLELDLADFHSIERFCEASVAIGPIDILINNAGIMATPETRLHDEWESQFAINHLGHFAMTHMLWKHISDGGRIVSVSSAGHHHSAMRWHDLFFMEGYDRWLAYGQSKTANALFALELDRRGAERGIKAFSVHPGKIFTPLQRHLTKQDMVEAGWIDDRGDPIDPTFKSTDQGAATQVWAATSALLEDRGGVYCEDCEVALIDDSAEPTFKGVRPHASDAGEAVRLWDISVSLTGFSRI